MNGLFNGVSYMRGLVRRLPDYTDARVLAATTNEDITIPATAKIAVISVNSATVNVYVERGGTAAVPAGDVTDGTASTLNGGAYSLDGISNLGIIADDACIVTIDYYSEIGAT